MIREPDHAGAEANALALAAKADCHQREERRQGEKHERRRSKGWRCGGPGHAMTEGGVASAAMATMAADRNRQDLQQPAIRTFGPVTVRPLRRWREACFVAHRATGPISCLHSASCSLDLMPHTSISTLVV